MRAAAALVGSLAMLIFMGRSLVTGQIPFAGDLLHFHYPLRDFYARQLAAGLAFDWMPGLFGGFYVVGEGQLGGYHPLHWLLYRLLPLDRAFAIELVVAYPFLYAGTWLWLRRSCGDAAAAFGAMAATFCGFSLVHGMHPNMMGALAHVPWLLFVLDGVAQRSGDRAAWWRPERRGAALVGLLVGSQLLLGHPQSVWLTALVAGAYAAHLITTDRPRRWIIGTTLAVGGLLGSAVGAVQVLPTLDAVAHSVRPAFDADFATQYSLRPLHLLQLLHPYLFWGRVARWNETAPAPDEYGVYGGAVVLILATWWLVRTWTARPRLRFSPQLALFGLVGMWLAIGSYGGLYYLQTWLPLVSQFRAPIRYTLFAQWALAVLAALGVAHLIRRDADGGSDRPAVVTTWLVVALAAATAMWLSAPGSSLAAIWMGPLVLAAAAGLLTLAVRGLRVAVVALVLLAAVDLAVYGLAGVVTWQDFITRQQVPGYLDTPSFLPRAGEGRLLRGNFPNLYLLANHRILDGYVAIVPSRQLDYHQPNAMRVAQVDYAHADFFKGAAPPDGAESRDRGWFRIPDALPRVRLMTETRVSTNPAADIGRVDVASTALVTHDVRLGTGPPGVARTVADLPGDILLDVDAPTAQLLAVSESFDEGWRATIDDAPASVERVNGDFLGTVVPAGRHDVRFQFRPTHLVVGRFVSLGALVLAAALLALRSSRT
jgi:hypothetical protein